MSRPINPKRNKIVTKDQFPKDENYEALMRLSDAVTFGGTAMLHSVRVGLSFMLASVSGMDPELKKNTSPETILTSMFAMLDTAGTEWEKGKAARLDAMIDEYEKKKVPD